MRTTFNRRSATKVKDGRVQRKNRHRPTGHDGYVLDRDSPGRGFRHVVSKRDVQAFIDIVPDWDRFSERLERIVLASHDDGWTVSTSFTTERKRERFSFMRGRTTFGHRLPPRTSMLTSIFLRGLVFLMTGRRRASYVGSRKRRLERSHSCTFSCTSLATITTAFTRSITVPAKVKTMRRGLPPAASNSCLSRTCAFSVIQAERPSKSAAGESHLFFREDQFFPRPFATSDSTAWHR